MSDTTKNLFDVILTMVGMIGAAVAFIYARRDWRESQRWKRTEQLEKLVAHFESDSLLRLATVILDWTFRHTSYAGKELAIVNDDVLLALRDHQKLKPGEEYEGEQAKIRDAYDALLAFFGRLDLAVSEKLIDSAPAKLYFVYWLERFITMDRHPDTHGILNGRTPQEMAAQYVRAYGDVPSMTRLCVNFGLKFNPSASAGDIAIPQDADAASSE